MNKNSMWAKTGALAVIGGLALVGLSGGANAATAPEPALRQAYASAPKDSVVSSSIKDGNVYQADINGGVVKVLRTPLAGSVWTSTLNPNIVQESNLSPAVRAKLNAPAPQDVAGKADVEQEFGPTTIAKIGGPFLANRTEVGTFTLPAGRWLINTSAFFARTVAGAEGTRPQLVLRYDRTDDNPFGKDAGTILGQEISESANRELSASTVKLVTVDEDTLVHVDAFGYNDDTSAAGGGEIKVSASIVAARS